MADNRFNNTNNDDFEDIFSNASKNDSYEDIFSNSANDDSFEDVSSFSNDLKQNKIDEDELFNDDFTVKYNSAVQNRRKENIQYDDINEVYGDISSRDTNGTKNKKDKKKLTPVKKGLIIALCVVLILVSCLGIYGYNTANSLFSSFNTDEQLEDNQYIDANQLYSMPDQINVLLVGVDAREGETVSRSDTMMLVTLDNKNGQLKLTSFLRDSYVEIAGKNCSSKLNAAYSWGSIQMLVDTLELNFKVDIPYYVVVDFEIFMNIVDALGGIEIDVTERESNYIKNSRRPNIPVEIPAGENVHVNGEQALWYSRIRKLDSDFMRTKRQRQVITSIVDKALTMKLPELINIAKEIAPLVKTNLDSKTIMSLGAEALFEKMYSYEIVQHKIPADGTWSSKNISGVGSSLVMNMDENVELLHSFLAEEQVVEEETTKAK